jgi:N-dimethylarginine dimethylaminohydrolase
MYDVNRNSCKGLIQMKKHETIYATKCETCNLSENCMNLNPYKCQKYAESVDSNFKYVLDPELLYLEKQILQYS